MASFVSSASTLVAHDVDHDDKRPELLDEETDSKMSEMSVILATGKHFDSLST